MTENDSLGAFMFLRFLAVVLCLTGPAMAECLTQEDFIDAEVTVGLQAGDDLAEFGMQRRQHEVPALARGQRGMHGDHGPQKGHRNGRNG